VKIYESDLDFLGKILVVQQFSGIARATYGFYKIFNNFNRQDSLSIEKYKKGKYYVYRGLIEIIPIISTISLILFDFLNKYQIDVTINNPEKSFKLNVEVWKAFASKRHLFNFFENIYIFSLVDVEESKNYGFIYKLNDYGFIKK